jgi:hypothetical protein
MRCVDCLNLKTKTFTRDTIREAPEFRVPAVMRMLSIKESAQVCWCALGKLPRKIYIYPSVLIENKESPQCDILLKETIKL